MRIIYTLLVIVFVAFVWYATMWFIQRTKNKSEQLKRDFPYPHENWFLGNRMETNYYLDVIFLWGWFVIPITLIGGFALIAKIWGLL